MASVIPKDFNLESYLVVFLSSPKDIKMNPSHALTIGSGYCVGTVTAEEIGSLLIS
jgi:hypothetical protein